MTRNRLLALSFFLVTLVGCSSKHEEQIQSVQTGPAHGSAGAGESGDSIQPTVQGLGKAQIFPSGYIVPQYPHSSVVLAMVQPTLTPGEQNQVMLKTTDAQPAITTYYNGWLAEQQWKPVYHYGNGGYDSTIWQKDGKQVEVRISPDPDGLKNIQLLSNLVDPNDDPSNLPTRVEGALTADDQNPGIGSDNSPPPVDSTLPATKRSSRP